MFCQLKAFFHGSSTSRYLLSSLAHQMSAESGQKHWNELIVWWFIIKVVGKSSHLIFRKLEIQLHPSKTFQQWIIPLPSFLGWLVETNFRSYQNHNCRKAECLSQPEIFWLMIWQFKDKNLMVINPFPNNITYYITTGRKKDKTVEESACLFWW